MPRQVACAQAAQERTGHACQAEERPCLPSDIASASMGDHREQARRADHHQRHRDGLLGLHAQHVDQDGHGQDR
eukprot:CAMPEP_0171266250 /NCGR_PEP_ID=MMETSP0790-20130122/58545_1 /TAXON_ID=2925 /ORGANISM="Alexandrium catenella, Strain OF101" /LENGTH=73 /DNA_ID=CAMNT_0011734947 /DNA_START=15 /DNA_END=232 /DNA_ORIENTATION=-